MTDTKTDIGLFEIVNQFIEVANKLVSEKGQDVNMVSTAIRYAAAKYNSYEASLKSDDLQRDKEDASKWFTDDFHMMLLKNMDDTILLASSDETT